MTMLGDIGSLDFSSPLTKLFHPMHPKPTNAAAGGIKTPTFVPSSAPQQTGDTPPPSNPSPTPVATAATAEISSSPPQTNNEIQIPSSSSSPTDTPPTTPPPPPSSPPPLDGSGSTSNSSGPTSYSSGLTSTPLGNTTNGASANSSQLNLAPYVTSHTTSPTSPKPILTPLANLSSFFIPTSSMIFLSNSSTIPPSITTSTSPASLHAGFNSRNTAAIAVSSLVFATLLALVVAFFIRRHRRKARAQITHTQSVNGSERGSNEMQFENGAEGTTTMSHDRDVFADSIMAHRPSASTPDAFVFSRFPSPDQFEDSSLLPVSGRQPPVEDLPSRVSSTLQSHDTVTPAPTDLFSFGDVSSYTSPSLYSHDTVATVPAEYFLNAAPPMPAPPQGDVPFFHHLKAMRRRGELRKTPSLSKSYLDTEPSEDAEHCDRPEGNQEGQDHVLTNIPRAESFTGFHAM